MQLNVCVGCLIGSFFYQSDNYLDVGLWYHRVIKKGKKCNVSVQRLARSFGTDRQPNGHRVTLLQG